jgi:hypothetical protein
MSTPAPAYAAPQEDVDHVVVLQVHRRERHQQGEHRQPHRQRRPAEGQRIEESEQRRRHVQGRDGAEHVGAARVEVREIRDARQLVPARGRARARRRGKTRRPDPVRGGVPRRRGRVEEVGEHAGDVHGQKGPGQPLAQAALRRVGPRPLPREVERQRHRHRQVRDVSEAADEVHGRPVAIDEDLVRTHPPAVDGDAEQRPVEIARLAHVHADALRQRRRQAGQVVAGAEHQEGHQRHHQAPRPRPHRARGDQARASEHVLAAHADRWRGDAQEQQAPPGRRQHEAPRSRQGRRRNSRRDVTRTVRHAGLLGEG